MQVTDEWQLLRRVGCGRRLKARQLSTTKDSGPRHEEHAALTVLHHSAAGLVLPTDRHLPRPITWLRSLHSKQQTASKCAFLLAHGLECHIHRSDMGIAVFDRTLVQCSKHAGVPALQPILLQSRGAIMRRALPKRYRVPGLASSS